jgi:Acetyltransferase (GNAT) domain
VGGIVYATEFQRGIAATEAMYLMIRHVFDELGYRRYAWQCNSLNARSRAAATRLGFKFEGIWRQANVHKGRNRDTAWFSILDREWPAIKIAFEHWLAPENFDTGGRQLSRLSIATLFPTRIGSVGSHCPIISASPSWRALLLWPHRP